jgi:thiosulfate dehydrogenase
MGFWEEGMKLRGFSASAVACVLAMLTPALAASDDDALVKRGEYLARLGDCGACHTAEGGKFMAGGLAFKTPTGVIYSTNITPDSKTGIGGYTLEQFDRALRRGVAADGHNLYPAMPYPSFAKTTDEDINALYAYVTKGVAPVEQANTPSEMRFPFSVRLGMAVWNFAFLEKGAFVPDVDKDPQWNRGAYIVEALGHCGTCHTPRGFGMQEKAMSDDGKAYLAGSTLSPWRSISLRNLTSESDTMQLLKTGANAHGAAFGPMTEVIHYSTQHFTDEDLQATVHYLRSLAPAGAAPPAAPVEVSDKVLYGSRGGLGYAQYCASCHRRDGLGAERVFPALVHNPSVLSNDPTSVVHVALTGWTAAETAAAPHRFSMPGYAALGDDEIAEILTFVRQSWGNNAVAVTATQVRAMREELALPPPAPKTRLTPRFAELLTEADADRLILGAKLMTETRALLPKNVGDAMNCSSCHLNGGTVAKASPLWGLASLFPINNPRAGRIITIEERLNGCFKRSMNGAPLAKDSKEMQAMVAFMEWLKVDAKPDAKADNKIEGRGTAKIDPALKADAARGEKLYKAECGVCHGEDGDGAKNAKGERMFPPLWGDASFNIGAGIARSATAAGFVKANMPVAHIHNFPQDQGGISDQDALDIAEYFTHQPRPDFPEKANDWPKGGKPQDARY